jgi:dynein heavy chain
MLSENFKGIDQAVSLSVKDWHKWYQFPDPESRNLPGEWQTKCEDPLKAMIVLRCLRPDRVTPAIKNYVNVNMGTYFTISNPTILREVLEESSNTEPIIFVLSPGVDPTDSLKKIAADKGIEFETNSMGKGQSEKARKIVGEGAEKGKWIFLANCHLSISLLPELESIMDNLFKGQDDPKKSSQSQVSENFRLILSASPHEEFSMSLL